MSCWKNLIDKMQIIYLLKNPLLPLSKFAYANFVWNFWEFKGFALKNPAQRLCLWNPPLFFEKKVDKKTYGSLRSDCLSEVEL